MRISKPAILATLAFSILSVTARAETPYCDYYAVGEYGRCYKNFKPRYPGDRPIAGRDTPDNSGAALIAVGGCVGGAALGYATGSSKLGAGICVGSIVVGVGVEAASAAEAPSQEELNNSEPTQSDQE